MGEFEMIDLSTGIGVHIDQNGNKRISKYDNCDFCNSKQEIALMRVWTLDGDWGYVCRKCDGL